MAFTNEMLAELEANYAAGVTSIGHGEKRVTYASLAEMWQAILRVRQSLRASSKRFVSGRIGYRKY